MLQTVFRHRLTGTHGCLGSELSGRLPNLHTQSFHGSAVRQIATSQYGALSIATAVGDLLWNQYQ